MSKNPIPKRPALSLLPKQEQLRLQIIWDIWTGNANPLREGKIESLHAATAAVRGIANRDSDFLVMYSWGNQERLAIAEALFAYSIGYQRETELRLDRFAYTRSTEL